MSKSTRNTVFTVVVLILSSVALGWTKKIAFQASPIQVSETVLSAANSSDRQAFPLKLEFGQLRVKLGQYQEIKVTTLPRANLDIVTIYPDGSVNNAQTLRTISDETGRYSLKFKLDDFAYLGVFQTRVLAHVNGQESSISGRFALQSWIQPDQGSGNDGYFYPLLP